MKKEDQVVSLELAMLMEELGANQDAWVSWIYYSHEDIYGMSKEEISRDIEFEWGLDCQLCHNVDYSKKYSAFSVAELGEMLPFNYIALKHISMERWFGVEFFMGGTAESIEINANTEADARAKVWLYLNKEGLL